MNRNFQFAATSLPGLPDVAIPVAAARAGALGVLDLEYTTDHAIAGQVVSRLVAAAPDRYAIRLDPTLAAVVDAALESLSGSDATVILTPADRDVLQSLVPRLKDAGLTVWLQASNVEQALLGQELNVDALLAKGHEAGGRVQDETTFVLLQRLLRNSSLAVWAEGGIGPHTASACYAAGAAGVVLGHQLALTRESALPEHARSVIARMDGSETVLVGEELGEAHRIYSRARLPVIDEIQQVAAGLLAQDAEEADGSTWRDEVVKRVGWDSPEESLWIIGQDAAFAGPLAKRYHTVGGIIAGLRDAISEHVRAARTAKPLAEKSPLAQSLGTRYPIVQGPMTRVSDRADFAACVADGGGLPFLALALLRAAELRSLFEETRERLAGRPWGVGILGFVPLELRQEQLEVIREFRPPYALIAGGRPDQAQSLERDGIPTFLHVPSPNLLKLFLDAGTRRFVFEGRECGGHVGPRTSFVLWELMIDVLLEMLTDEQLSDCHILFAGGVHDALSASMIACLAAPLAARGARIGVLMGTAYTLTAEAVSSGAIVPGFQEEALKCSQTTLLETGPGHATRCAITQFAQKFATQKRDLIASGKAAEEIRDSLEELNLGRLRVAAKGVDRNARYREDPTAPKLVDVDEQSQHEGGMYMIGQVAALRDRVCTIAELHEDVATNGTERLAQIDEMTTLQPAFAPSSKVEVAIVGMSCVLPKAPNLSAYWENILDEVYAITEVPKSRWDADLYFDADRNAPDKVYSKWGGFIDPVEFNPLDYGMPPASLPSVDTLQLLALKAARDAIADAGYAERPFDRAATSVILGASGGLGDLGTGYSVRSMLPEILGPQGHEAIDAAGERLPNWTEDSFAGLLPNVAAGRISNRLDLGGLNFVVDAACASSLAAVNLAVNELQSGNSSMVLVGGIDTIQSPFGFMCFSKTQALSPNGRPRTFDADADGIAIGEGVVMLVLKRLADAERDGDRIYSVIRGAAGSSDGKAMGLTAPRVEGQKQALARAYHKAGFSAATVGLYEAHGTGTIVGDRTEALALNEYLEQEGVPPQQTAIGSVKSMIGHTKATAGVAGLAKVALALYHKVLPATLGVTTPNADARLHDGPLYVNAQTRPWLRSPQRDVRRAGVSSFGFGGTNFHAILEEYTGNPSEGNLAIVERWPSELFCWKATTREDLNNQLQQLEAAIANGAQPRLPDLAALLGERAQRGGEVRLAIVAGSLEELSSRIATAREHVADVHKDVLQDPRGIYFSAVSRDPKAQVAFLFPGQGSQSPDMLRDLAIYFPEVRRAFERADACLADRFPNGLSTHIFPPPRFTEEDQQQAQQTLSQTNIAQPAIGAASVAMLELLKNLGLAPDMTAGHSYGEYVALHAGGVIDETTLHRLSEARGRFIIESAKDDLGTMAAASAGASEVAAAIEGLSDVWIANHNAPQQTIISGSNTGIEAAIERLKQQQIRAKRFPVSCAFHSPLVAAAKSLLAEYLASCEFNEPLRPVYSNTTARPHAQDAADIVELLSEHLVRPVEFVDEIEAMYAAGARTFVEVGPGNVLTNLTKRILGDRDHLAIATDASGRHGLIQLQHSLAQLLVAGLPVQVERLTRGRTQQTLALETLTKATRPADPSPTTWLVDGGRARPLTQSQPISQPKPKAISFAAPVASATPEPPPVVSAPPQNAAPTVTVAAPDSLASSTPDTPPMSHRNDPPARPAAEAPAPPTDPAAAVMLQYQELMTRFLQAQQQVMLGYLNGTPNASAELPGLPMPGALSRPTLEMPPAAQTGPMPESNTPEVPVESANASEVPADAIEQPTPADPVAATTEPPPAESPTTAVDADLLKQRLLELVSDRTGYPTDMLDLDLDIEAELGIDSIKRVEILAMLQNSCMPECWESGENDMEELLKFKTMRGIVDWMAAQADSAGAKTTPASTATSTAAPAPVATGVSQEQLTQQLLELVSDRTGYPPEMLDLDLDIEAELGIDSIKRVEILAMLQNNCMPAGWESGEDDMEQLLKFKTMRGIVEWMADRAGSAPAAVAVETEPPQSAAAPAAASGRVSQDALTQQLLELVSDRTGYPTEMLDLDLDIEAELGIDSIKRVEILAMLQNNCMPAGWESGEDDMEQLLKFKTMRGIVDWMTSAAGVTRNGSASNVTHPPAPATSQVAVAQANGQSTSQSIEQNTQAVTSQHVPRFSYKMVEAPAAPRELPRRNTGVLIVTDDETGIADAVLSRLEDAGIAAVRVRRGDQFSVVDNSNYLVDLADSGSVEQLMQQLDADYGSVAGILHLLPLRRATSFDKLDTTGWDLRNRQEVKGLFHLARAAAQDIRQASEQGAGWVITATRLGGGLGSTVDESAAYFPGHGGLAGLIKTLALEWTDAHCKLVDADTATAGNANELASLILEELSQEPCREEVEVGYMHGRRHAPRVTRLPLEGRPPSDLQITSESVILVTGGARGITSTIATELAESFQPTILIAGRSPEPVGEEDAQTAGLTTAQELKGALIEQFRSDGRTATPRDIEQAYTHLIRQREMRDNLARLRELGSTVHYFQVDVRDDAAFGELIDTIYDRFGHIDGVIHGAGVIEDKLLEQKSEESFDRVFETKTRSAFTLSRKLHGASLQFLVFFSSMAGRFGNRGQSDYAAANEVLNKLAVHLDRQWPARVVAINWGPWQTGMVSPEVQKQFAERGVQLIPPADGARVLVKELLKGAKGEVEIVLGDGPWKHLIAEIPPKESPAALPFITETPQVVSGGAIEFIRTLDIQEDLYLTDHVLDGKPVLPLAAAMELAAEIAQHAFPELRFVGLRSMTMLSGIILDSESKEIRIAARGQTDPSHESLDVEVSVEISEVGKSGRPSYRGTVVLSDRYPAPPRLDLSGFDNLEPLPMTVEDCYDQWLFHGPCFQSITHVPGLNRHGIVADIDRSLPADCLASQPDGQWLVDPVMVDCGFQLGILWERVHYEMTPLPARIDSFRRFGEFDSQAVRTYFVARPDVQGRILDCDIHFFDADGRLVASVENLQTACSKELNRLAERGVSPA